MVVRELIEDSILIMKLLIKTYKEKGISYDAFKKESELKIQFLLIQREDSATPEQKQMIIDVLDEYYGLIRQKEHSCSIVV